MQPHLVHRDPPSLVTLSMRGVVDALAEGQLDSATSLVVPLRPGRKHLVPAATWGQVRIDDADLSWSGQDAHRLSLLLGLRSAGFGTRMLREAAPAYQVMRAADTRRWLTITAAWAELAPWRAPDNPWMELCLRITTPLVERSR